MNYSSIWPDVIGNGHQPNSVGVYRDPFFERISYIRGGMNPFCKDFLYWRWDELYPPIVLY